MKIWLCAWCIIYEERKSKFALYLLLLVICFIILNEPLQFQSPFLAILNSYFEQLLHNCAVEIDTEVAISYPINNY